jgi:hypothetical protein
MSHSQISLLPQQSPSTSLQVNNESFRISFIDDISQKQINFKTGWLVHGYLTALMFESTKTPVPFWSL